MRNAIRALTTYALPIVVAFSASRCEGEAPDKPKREAGTQSDDAKEFAAYAKATAESYELRAGDDGQRKLSLLAEPVLRWTNPLDSAQGHGEIFLWTDAGLPAAVVSLNEYYDKAGRKHEQHEWCSLANGPITADGPYRWAPGMGLLSPELAKGAEAPAETAGRRLRQMRRLAQDFAGEKTTRDGVTRTLRLLTKPIYRYPSAKGEILDGAIFALVEATDPEALVVLEARRSESAYAWHYAFARMTSVGLSASYRGARVWEAPELEGREVYGRRDKPYAAFIAK
ncbi:MAG TPA: hypothetical protein VMV10_28255 [Pirellulales bacterium]|nr:hypothetical protein [Pirellulales bacterium]